MSVEDDRFADVAAAIGDGTPIDWSRLEGKSTTEGDREILDTLRRVEAMARSSRAVQRPEFVESAGLAEPWGPLLKLERLGHGSTGEVWRAFEPRLKREVALKLLSPASAPAPAARASLLEEGAHLARIRHPGVVTVHGIDEHDGEIGLWMELLEGTSLGALVEVGGALSAAEAAALGIDVCRALAAIHAAGLVHRDIKPDNILRTIGGRVVITDFGLGQPEDRDPAAPPDKSGTPMYMPPEVLAGAPATSASDLYALGVLLFYLVTGAHPHPAGTLAELLESHRRQTGRRLRDLRPELSTGFIQTIERAIDPEPARRFATAGEFEAALLASLTGEASATSVPAAARGTRATRPGRRAIVAGVAALLLVVAAAFVIRALRPTVPEPPYDVEAFLSRGTGESSRPLADGDRVEPGDRLTLQFVASQTLHVYVLNQDDRGETYLLFPQPAYDQSNPLPAGRLYRLPGTVGGRTTAWTVTSAGGHEHFLVVASPKRLPELEETLAALPPPVRGRAVEPAAVPLSNDNVTKLRGVGGYDVDASVSEGTAARPLFDVVRRLAGKESGVRGVWLRQVTLTNPGPPIVH